jgi:hypothetical protein
VPPSFTTVDAAAGSPACTPVRMFSVRNYQERIRTAFENAHCPYSAQDNIIIITFYFILIIWLEQR